MNTPHARETGSPTRRTFALSHEQTLALHDIAATAPADSLSDPVYASRINAWWMGAGLSMGFRWTTIDDMLWHDARGLACTMPPARADLQFLTFSAEPDGDAGLMALLTQATGLLVDADRLFRKYEAHHRAKIGNECVTVPYDADAAALEKAETNAEIAGRIERFFSRQWVTADGLREARQDSLIAFGAGFTAAKLAVTAALNDMPHGMDGTIAVDDARDAILNIDQPEDLDEQFAPYRRVMEQGIAMADPPFPQPLTEEELARAMGMDTPSGRVAGRFYRMPAAGPAPGQSPCSIENGGFMAGLNAQIDRTAAEALVDSTTIVDIPPYRGPKSVITNIERRPLAEGLECEDGE